MIKHQIKVGTSNFRKLVSSDGLTADLNRLFVDKTLFIKDFLDHSNDVVLITRPRRWGKSSILSMLQHFFSKEVKGLSTKELFKNLKIASYLDDPKYKQYQGTRPVIIVNFKDISGDNYTDLKTTIMDTIVELYEEHSEFILQQNPSIANRSKFERILNGQCSYGELINSIKFLSKLLCKYHGKKVFILVDEYDNAINDLFNKPKTLKKLTKLFSKLLGACLKDNDDNLEKGLITGVLRVAKANIFSGLNNPTEETILDYKFSEHYGFSEKEVNELLDKAGIVNKQEIKIWYNGYIVGNNTIYNPWSIMQCIDHDGDLQAYWANSANPKIIKDLLINKTTYKYKQKIKDLIKNKEATLEHNLKKYVSYEDLQTQPEILWSLLVHTGYLTLIDSKDMRQVKLPNQEISILLKEYVDNWFTINPILSDAANSLLIGDFIGFEEALIEILGNPAFSARIFSGCGSTANSSATEKTKEFMYQFLIMTELQCINLGSSEYEVFAEPEKVSIRKTRPDCLILNHTKKLCIVIELKVSLRKNENLQELANKAIGQIEKNQYGKIYQEQGYQIFKLAIAFKGNNFELAYEGQEE